MNISLQVLPALDILLHFFASIEVDSAILLHMMWTDAIVLPQWDLPLQCDAAVMSVGVLKSQVPSPCSD
jgi:hypothetical protein